MPITADNKKRAGFGVLPYPTLQTKIEAQNMLDHCTPHVFYCLLCAVNLKSNE